MKAFKNNMKNTRTASATAYARREQPAMREQCAFLILRRHSQKWYYWGQSSGHHRKRIITYVKEFKPFKTDPETPICLKMNGFSAL
jgi:hypothetical protein